MLWTTDIDLQQTIAHAPVGICLLDAASMVVELANKKFLETTCRPAENFIGRSYWEIFATLRKEHEPALRQIVVSGETYYAEKLDLETEDRSTAEVLALNFIYVPVKDKEDVIKKIAVWVTKNNQDLAERKKEEAATKAFQQERDRLKSFLMQAPAGISILTGPNLVYELINPAYQQILAGRNLIGRPIFEAVPELVGTPLQKSLLRVYQKGEVLEVNELMVPIADYEGGPTHERYFSFTYQPWRDEHDQIEGIPSIWSCSSRHG